MKKRFFSLLLAAILIVTALPAAAFAAQSAGLSNFAKTNTYADGKFTDVKADDWFEKNVSAAYELNLMVGKGDDFFDTENNLTVAEAMTIAARLRSIYYTGKAEFEQGEPWYQVYANYCKINGVADPADYDMNKAVTRGEFAEIFAKAFPSDALKKINTVHDNMIPDVKKADKFGAAIYLLYRAGILVGNDSKGTFAPDTNIKRAEAAAITTRMADSSLREKISLVDPAYNDWYYVPATPTVYTVSFDMQGHGTTPTNLTVNEGDKITKPADPTFVNHTLEGWYRIKNADGTLSDKWNFDTDTVTGNMTLYAKWTRKITNIIGTVDFPMIASEIPANAWVDSTKPKTKVYAQDNFIFYIIWVNDTSRTDEEFQFTYLAETSADKIGNSYTYINDNIKYAVTFEMTNEDKLESIEIKALDGADKSVQDAAGTYVAPTYYTVSFDMQGHGTTPTNLTVNEGDKITDLPVPTATDLVFGGWYKDASCTDLNKWATATDLVTQDITLYAKWTDITFKEIGGVKWATKNLGAEKETDYGDYFAWGETEPYYEGTGGRPATPTWKSGKESGYAWQSYCGSSSFSEWSTPPYDATTKILNPEFDAATALLGSGWRMPTSAEFKSLHDACLNGSYDTTTNPSGASASVGKGIYWCTNYDGVVGYLFCDGTNKLFFPAAGYVSGNGLSNAGIQGYYWSSTLYPGDTSDAWRMFFYNTGFNLQHYISRYLGHSVRPVVKEE